MSKRPEKKVLDAIDELVEDSLRKPKDDYRQPFSDTCAVCRHEWHGVTNGIGCPGVFATDQQIQAWHDTIEALQTSDEIAVVPEEFVDLGHVDRVTTTWWKVLATRMFAFLTRSKVLCLHHHWRTCKLAVTAVDAAQNLLGL